MASRPIWTGSLGFGLVNIPVRLHLAAKSERISFHMIHAEDGGRIHYKRVCEVDGEEVPWDGVVKGYEYAKGEYITLTDEDLKSIDIGLLRTIDIERFVEASDIDPVYFDRPYLVEPAKGAERAYALLREALLKSNRVGIGRIVFREREYLAAIRVRGQALGLSTMRFASEVRGEKELDLPSSAEARLAEKQLKLAESLIDQLSGDWKPEEFKDRYQEAMKRLIERKLEGAPLPRAPKAGPGGKVLDLTEVLKRSLERRPHKGERKAPSRQAARKSKAPGRKPGRRKGTA